MKDSSLREQRAQETKRQILAAAEALFGEHGTHRVSMRNIAAQAHVTTGALYHHFASKEDIVATLKRDRATALGRILEQTRVEHNPLSHLYRFLCALVDYEVSQTGYTMSEFRKSHRGEKVDPVDDTSTLHPIAGLIRQAQEAGMLDTQWPPEDVAFCILYHVLWGVRFEMSINPDTRQECAQMIQRNLDLVLRAHLPGTHQRQNQWMEERPS